MADEAGASEPGEKITERRRVEHASVVENDERHRSSVPETGLLLEERDVVVPGQIVQAPFARLDPRAPARYRRPRDHR